MKDLIASPCPFCGSSKIEEFHSHLECRVCGASGPEITSVERNMGGPEVRRHYAYERWNRRVETGLPTSIQEALNSGDGVYRP